MTTRLPYNPKAVRQLTKKEFKNIDSILRGNRAFYSIWDSDKFDYICENKKKQDALYFAHNTYHEALKKVEDRIGFIFGLAIDMVVDYKTGRMYEYMQGYTLCEYIEAYAVELKVPQIKPVKKYVKEYDFSYFGEDDLSEVSGDQLMELINFGCQGDK